MRHSERDTEGYFSETLSGFPLGLDSIPAGFPSPVDNTDTERLDLTAHLIRHPEATFFLRVNGHSMIGAGIFDGDLIIVDRSLTPLSGDIVVAVLDGEFTIKRLWVKGNQIELKPENPKFKTIRVADESQLEVWGVVTAAVKSFR
ncbi:MAG: translesion error-prone DNA polymerase V autoproteolytic subunit [Planctomycetaceae bacterium]|jgi:DNA polymerase V|nr:translesion error-prone DNA polymerase V autoproteolytic subunit [Planctomycetaceae bacterium]